MQTDPSSTPQPLCTHSYGLADMGLVVRTVAGDGVPGGIHVSVLPRGGQ